MKFPNFLKKVIISKEDSVKDIYDNYYILTKLDDRNFELKFHEHIFGRMSISKRGANDGYVADVDIEGKKFLFQPIRKFWPRQFKIIEKATNEEVLMRFGFLGLTGKMVLHGTTYYFSAGGGKLVTNHLWEYKKIIDGHEEPRVLSTWSRGLLPPGITIASSEAVSECADSLMLILFARYLQMAYIAGY